MNVRRILLLLVAAIAALGVALLVRGMVGAGKRPPQQTVVVQAPQVSKVLVAARDIATGEVLDESKVTWQDWPGTTLDPSLIRGDDKTPVGTFVANSTARAPMVKGEPVTAAKLLKNGTAGVLAASLKPGMRAASITVSVATVAGGFILPGNHVDVVLTTTIAGNARAEILASDVRVMAVDQNYDPGASKIVNDVRTVTLELTPEQVKILAQKQTMGTLSLALRPLSDSANGGTGGRDTSETMTIVRGTSGPQDDGR